MNPVAADCQRRDQLRLIGKPLRPAFANGLFVDIVFGELDEEMIMTCFAFHKTAIELPEIGIFKALAKAFEPLATAGFDEGEDQQPIEKAGFFAAALALEFH